MSSFICADKTLQGIVSYFDLDTRFVNSSICYGEIGRKLKKIGFNLEFAEHRDRLIKEMAMLNQMGVNERYDKQDIENNISFKDEFAPKPVQAYKWLSCFIYQCSEGDIPETSQLYKTLDEIKSYLAECIVGNLPEYDKAIWD